MKLAVVSKGGAGKTTVATGLARALAVRGARGEKTACEIATAEGLDRWIASTKV